MARKVKKSKPKKKNKGGRPVLFKTAREMQEKIDEYFESCWIEKITEVAEKDGKITTSNSRYQNKPYTMMGLAMTLGMSRETLCQYRKKDKFSDTINKARQKVEMNVEEYLLEGKNAAGPIFWLKNNAEKKYRDKSELEAYGPDGQPLGGTTVNINATAMEVAVKVAYMLREQLDSEHKQKPREITAGENEKPD